MHEGFTVRAFLEFISTDLARFGMVIRAIPIGFGTAFLGFKNTENDIGGLVGYRKGVHKSFRVNLLYMFNLHILSRT